MNIYDHIRSTKDDVETSFFDIFDKFPDLASEFLVKLHSNNVNGMLFNPEDPSCCLMGLCGNRLGYSEGSLMRTRIDVTGSGHQPPVEDLVIKIRTRRETISELAREEATRITTMWMESRGKMK